MTKSEAIELIQKACKTITDYNDENLSVIEKIIQQYLAKHPTDSDMWLRLTMLEFTPPWEDPEKIQSYLMQILSYDPYNLKTILTLAYMQSLFFGEMTNATFNILNSLTTNDPEYLSMLEYAKAKYYKDKMKNENKYKKEYIKHLEKSIKYFNKHVRNYERLGRYFIAEGEKEKGKMLIKKALENIQHIYPEIDTNEDLTDIEDFFNYYYKGTHTTAEDKASMLKIL